MTDLDTTLPFPYQSDQQLANWQEASATEFVDFLFDKLVSHVDMDMLDLQDHDDHATALDFQQLELDV